MASTTIGRSSGDTSLALKGAPDSTIGNSSAAAPCMHALQIEIARELVRDMAKSVRSGRPVEITFGKRPLLRFGQRELPLHITPSAFRHEIYQARGEQHGPDKTAEFAGLVIHSIVEDDAETQTANAMAAADKLKEQMRSWQQERDATKTTVVNHVKSTQRAPVNNKTTAGLRRTIPQSLPASPSLYPSSASQPSPAFSQSDDFSKTQAHRFVLTHLLAIQALSLEEIHKRTSIPREDCSKLLEKVGEEAGSSWNLDKRAYKDLDIWRFPYSDDDREAALDNAIRAFDRQRISTEDKIWQRLLPLEERGKGKILSRLNLHAHTAKPSQSSNADSQGSSTPISRPPNDHRKLLAAGLGGEPMARSKSDESVKSKKPSERELQTKRLISGKPSKPAALAKPTKKSVEEESKPSKPPKTGEKRKPDTKALSAEFVHSSDEDDVDVNSIQKNRKKLKDRDGLAKPAPSAAKPAASTSKLASTSKKEQQPAEHVPPKKVQSLNKTSGILAKRDSPVPTSHKPQSAVTKTDLGPPVAKPSPSLKPTITKRTVLTTKTIKASASSAHKKQPSTESLSSTSSKTNASSQGTTTRLLETGNAAKKAATTGTKDSAKVQLSTHKRTISQSLSADSTSRPSSSASSNASARNGLRRPASSRDAVGDKRLGQGPQPFKRPRTDSSPSASSPLSSVTSVASSKSARLPDLPPKHDARPVSPPRQARMEEIKAHQAKAFSEYINIRMKLESSGSAAEAANLRAKCDQKFKEYDFLSGEVANIENVPKNELPVPASATSFPPDSAVFFLGRYNELQKKYDALHEKLTKANNSKDGKASDVEKKRLWSMHSELNNLKKLHTAAESSERMAKEEAMIAQAGRSTAAVESLSRDRTMDEYGRYHVLFASWSAFRMDLRSDAAYPQVGSDKIEKDQRMFRRLCEMQKQLLAGFEEMLRAFSKPPEGTTRAVDGEVLNSQDAQLLAWKTKSRLYEWKQQHDYVFSQFGSATKEEMDALWKTQEGLKNDERSVLRAFALGYGEKKVGTFDNLNLDAVTVGLGK